MIGMDGILRALGVVRADLGDKQATRKAVSDGAELTAAYLIMNSAAALIAGYGLLADSAAVIIGAMLIAMLYGPILGIALALAELSSGLLRRSIRAEFAGVFLVFATGFGLGLVHADVPLTEQIIQRTSPNILDLMIALVGGAAGAYATMSVRVAGAVVGVAIATSLCPPLVASGILLAHAFPALAADALLLFLTNFSAIAAGAMVVFVLRGHYVPVGEIAGSLRFLPLLMMLAIAVQLVATFHASVAERNLRGTVTKALAAPLAAHPAGLVEIRVRARAQPPVVIAIVRAQTPFSVAQVAAMDDAIDAAAGRDVLLRLSVIPVIEITRHGVVGSSPIGLPR